jgi:hypothetical protein
LNLNQKNIEKIMVKILILNSLQNRGTSKKFREGTPVFFWKCAKKGCVMVILSPLFNKFKGLRQKTYTRYVARSATYVA